MSSTLWRAPSTASSTHPGSRWVMRAGMAVIAVLFAAYMSAIYWNARDWTWRSTGGRRRSSTA